MPSAALRTASIVGARPQFVKLAPISTAMNSADVAIEDRIIHTGQHYDDEMSKVFFDELNIPQPWTNLAVGSGSHASQTARMLEGIETCLLNLQPDIVIVYGDTNSTAAGALAAAKLKIPVAHVEAGLRSNNREMPEELNRIVADHLSEILFAPTTTAMANLESEGLHRRALLTGDVMFDAVLGNVEIARARSSAYRNLHVQPGSYGVATLHRAENTSAERLLPVLERLNAASVAFGTIVFPLHPRTAAVIARELPQWKATTTLKIVPPQSYLDMLCLVDGAKWVITDSGGLQKEAFFLGTPCLTVRSETEWPETVEFGGNRLIGSDAAGLLGALESLAGGNQAAVPRHPRPSDGPFGDGNAARIIVDAILKHTGHSP